MTDSIVISRVAKSYGKVAAIREVSFALEEGQTVALVGHNGAGKTTLIKLMLGLIRPSAGEVRVLGDNPAAGEFAARRRLGFLPENVSFNMSLTGRETLAFYAGLKGVSGAECTRLLDRVGLGEAASRRVGTYSKGMRQRLGLAQALLGDPRVLLLDEPTTGLDPALRRAFYDIVSELRDSGATVLLSSHALTELEGEADRVLIVDRGEKIADGTVDQLRGMARLPTRIRVRLAGHGATEIEAWMARTGADWRRVGEGIREVEAAPEDKVKVLRQATAMDAPVADIEVIPPTLDELYAHFLNQRQIA